MGEQAIPEVVEAAETVANAEAAEAPEAFEVTPEQQEKLAKLRESVRQLGCAAVSFSGGVDSTFLLAVAREELGERVFAMTATSALTPKRETEGAQAFCRSLGVLQVVFHHDFEAVEGLCDNPRNRCYLCKTDLFSRLRQGADQIAWQLGLIQRGQRIAFLEGSNMSDLNDFRPGAQAVSEQGALSPLQDAGLTKDDIRALSRQMGLPTWDKPSFACLASRFEYGQRITPKALKRVEEAESFLMEAGFAQVRVRVHGADGQLARVETLPEDTDRLFAFMREGGSKTLHRLGFTHVSVDADGYRTGSMNE